MWNHDAFDVTSDQPWPHHGQGKRVISSGIGGIFDFPLVQPVPQAYTTLDLVQARMGGQNMVSEATDDASAGAFQEPTFNGIIQIISLEVDGYLAPIYRPPYSRRFTVATFRVTGVDADGAVTEIEPRKLGDEHSPIKTCGYYQTAPASPNSPIGGDGSGLSLSVTFITPDTVSLTYPITVDSVTIASGGTGYEVGDVVGLVGGNSFLPPKVISSTTALVCHALYQRRLAPGELGRFQNPFYEEAKAWRKDLAAIGHGELELDADWPRSFSAGFAVVERSRLDDTTL